MSCDATATTADSMLIPVAAAGLSAASSSSSSVSCKQEEHKSEKTLRCSVKNLKNPKESKEPARLGVLPKPCYSLVSRLTQSSVDGLLQRSLEGH